MDGVGNEEVRRRVGIEREFLSSEDQRVLRWFGHVERMDEYRMARRELMAEVSEGRVQGRPMLGWMDDVKVTLGHLFISNSIHWSDSPRHGGVTPPGCASGSALACGACKL